MNLPTIIKARSKCSRTQPGAFLGNAERSERSLFIKKPCILIRSETFLNLSLISQFSISVPQVRSDEKNSCRQYSNVGLILTFLSVLIIFPSSTPDGLFLIFFLISKYADQDQNKTKTHVVEKVLPCSPVLGLQSSTVRSHSWYLVSQVATPHTFTYKLLGHVCCAQRGRQLPADVNTKPGKPSLSLVLLFGHLGS